MCELPTGKSFQVATSSTLHLLPPITPLSRPSFSSLPTVAWPHGNSDREAVSTLSKQSRPHSARTTTAATSPSLAARYCFYPTPRTPPSPPTLATAPDDAWRHLPAHEPPSSPPPSSLPRARAVLTSPRAETPDTLEVIGREPLAAREGRVRAAMDDKDPPPFGCMYPRCCGQQYR
jgi:hypothetical protein